MTGCGLSLYLDSKKSYVGDYAESSIVSFIQAGQLYILYSGWTIIRIPHNSLVVEKLDPEKFGELILVSLESKFFVE